MNGTVVSIFMTPSSGTVLSAVDEAVLEAGRGLVGDRYYLGSGTFSESLKGKPEAEITLIEYEEIEQFNQTERTNRSPGAFRRNIVTRGVRLNDLVGRRFRVGAAELEGICLCEPCGHLAKLVSPSVVKRMKTRDGRSTMPDRRLRVLRDDQRAGFPVALLNIKAITALRVWLTTQRTCRLLAFLATSAAVSVAAHSQEAAPAAVAATPTVEEVVVTGSRIASPNLQATSPITVVDSKAIQTTGRTDISDIIMPHSVFHQWLQN